MFSTLKGKLILGVYIFIILSIPIGAYLVSQQQNLKTSANQSKQTTSVKEATPSAKSSVPKSTGSPAKEIQQLAEQSNPLGAPSPTPEPSITTADSFGPTLSFKAILEGRPANNQADKMFVGIAEGSLSTNPKFLLSFTVDLPASGNFSNLSLAGLTSGSNYTALLKGSSQIATSSAFVMSPTVTNLNNGQTLTLLSGDLNDDNVINSADYSIAQKALNSTSSSSNWNAAADINKDGVVNALDLAYIIKNFGKTGASAAWVSPIPTSSPSASLIQPIGGAQGSTGYWVWVPR